MPSFELKFILLLDWPPTKASKHYPRLANNPHAFTKGVWAKTNDRVLARIILRTPIPHSAAMATRIASA